MSISLRELSERINAGIPVGTIIAYYGNDQPNGWLICDGRSCSGTDLSSKLGINNVPDLRGRFIRMIGGNAAGMAVAQGDELRSHSHYMNTGYTYTGGGHFKPVCDHPDNTRISTQATGGNETRPVNMAFNYIIRANYSLRIISILYSFLVISLYNVRR